MTPELRRALADLQTARPQAYSRVLHVGISNCRHKNNDPDAPWSEHAWENAADLMLTSDGQPATGAAKAAGDELAAYMRSRPDLWAEVFWQVQAHFNHPHGTAAPRRNYDDQQVPPCAGGEPPQEDDMLLPITKESGTEDIRFLQSLLNESFEAGIAEDGVYGPDTVAAVKAHTGRFTNNTGWAEGNGVGSNQWTELWRAWLAEQASTGLTQAQADKRYTKKGSVINMSGKTP